MRVAIVGAGLFGSIIGDLLRHRLGADVVLFDRGEYTRGSAPAACLMKPSWMAKVPDYKKLLDILSTLYPVYEVPFSTLVGEQKVFWVDPVSVMGSQAPRTRLVDVTRAGNGWISYCQDGEYRKESFDLVVVAAGVWTPHLFPNMVDVKIKAGVSFTGPGDTESAIKIWAPYKQLVKFNIAPGTIWVGDGTSKNRLGYADVMDCRRRCEEFVGEDQAGMMTARIGYRPFVPGLKAPAYVGWPHTNTVVATGGAKNGTIGAVWAGMEIVRHLGGE